MRNRYDRTERCSILSPAYGERNNKNFTLTCALDEPFSRSFVIFRRWDRGFGLTPIGPTPNAQSSPSGSLGHISINTALRSSLSCLTISLMQLLPNLSSGYSTFDPDTDIPADLKGKVVLITGAK